jgi:hypothetical protein
MSMHVDFRIEILRHFRLRHDAKASYLNKRPHIRFSKNSQLSRIYAICAKLSRMVYPKNPVNLERRRRITLT